MSEDTISRQAAIDALDKIFPADPMRNDYTQGITCGAALATEYIKQLPSAQPEERTEERTETHACDLIDRQAAIDAVEWGITYARAINTCTGETKELFRVSNYALKEASERIKELPSAQPDSKELSFTQKKLDTISRKAAIESVSRMMHDCFGSGDEEMDAIAVTLDELPSAQPERTCVNCGRTVNNGGWYADGGTRCPIEEHYALPKDGFCHLWEKRNVTDDDYPERRTDD